MTYAIRIPRRRTHRLGVLVLAALFAGCAAAPEGESTVQATATPASAAPAGFVATDEFKSVGAANAPITIMEFTDLQCPYCATFAIGTWPALRERYVETGQVRFVSRDLPLPMHAQAVPAAVATRCAGEQGRYWEYRDALFRVQSRLASAPYESLAAALGLDMTRFAACRSDGRQAALVRADMNFAAAYGIDTTPSFVIGRVIDGRLVGKIMPGAQPLEVFEQQIEALSGAAP